MSSNIQWLEYDAVTGRILGHVSGRSLGLPTYRENLGVIIEKEYHDGALFFVENGEVVPRPVGPVQLAYTQYTGVVLLTGVPMGSRILIAGAGDGDHVMDSEDGIMKLTFTTPGRYEISWEAFPYQRFSAWVEA